MRVRRTAIRLLVVTIVTSAVLVAAPPFGPESRAGDATRPPAQVATAAVTATRC